MSLPGGPRKDITLYITDEFKQAVAAYVHGVATAEQAVLVIAEHNAQARLEAVQRILEEVDEKLADNKADAFDRLEKSLTEGVSGRPDWYAFKANSYRERAELIKYKHKLEVALRNLRPNKNTRQWGELQQYRRISGTAIAALQQMLPYPPAVEALCQIDVELKQHGSSLEALYGSQ